MNVLDISADNAWHFQDKADLTNSNDVMKLFNDIQQSKSQFQLQFWIWFEVGTINSNDVYSEKRPR